MLSPRTLQRQLQAEGTSYQIVLSDTRENPLLALWNRGPVQGCVRSFDRPVSVYAFTHQDDFDWGDFAVATTQGAVVGAVGGFLAPAGTALASQLGLQGGRALGVAVVTDAAIGMGLTWAINTVQCQPTTPTDLLVGALTGGLGNLIKPAWGAMRNGLRGLAAPKVTVSAHAPGLPPSVRGNGASKPPWAPVNTFPAGPGWALEGQLRIADQMA